MILFGLVHCSGGIQTLMAPVAPLSEPGDEVDLGQLDVNEEVSLWVAAGPRRDGPWCQRVPARPSQQGEDVARICPLGTHPLAFNLNPEGHGRLKNIKGFLDRQPCFRSVGFCHLPP